MIVKLDGIQTFLLTVSSGRNDIAEGIIKLPNFNNVRFMMKDAQRTGGDREIVSIIWTG